MPISSIAEGTARCHDPSPAGVAQRRDPAAPARSGSSYYRATARLKVATLPLAGDRKADLCIVGGGLTGLSAALHAARAGLDIVLLECGALGDGASGRNGGQTFAASTVRREWSVNSLHGPHRVAPIFTPPSDSVTSSLSANQSERERGCWGWMFFTNPCRPRATLLAQALSLFS